MTLSRWQLQVLDELGVARYRPRSAPAPYISQRIREHLKLWRQNLDDVLERLSDLPSPTTAAAKRAWYLRMKTLK
jgi:hypothetical protein